MKVIKNYDQVGLTPEIIKAAVTAYVEQQTKREVRMVMLSGSGGYCELEDPPFAKVKQ